MDIWQYVNGLSYHPSDRRYNEVNTGAGIGLRNKDLNTIKEIAIGQYLNSINKESNYIDASMFKKLNGLFSVGAGAGVVTGYGEPKPYVLPALKLGNDNYEVNLRYAPKYKDNPETWMMNFGLKIK